MDQNIDDVFEAAVLETMLLLSSLSTAVEVRYAVRERRAGRDPSSQEESIAVRTRLINDQADLREMLVRVQSGLAYIQNAREEHHAMLVRRFDLLLTLRRIDRILQSIHQRLLSLYPEVGEALVEETRLVHTRLMNLSDVQEDELSLTALGQFIERSFQLLSWIDREV